MLQIREVQKQFVKKRTNIVAMDHISLSLEAGKLAVVNGPSGSGKSTLLLVCGGLLHPDAGKVLLDGDDPYAMSADRRARFRAEKIGFVFQQFHLVPYLTVLENVMAPGIAAHLSVPEARTRADELLKRFALTERAGHLPSELSTGQSQRAALARAMLCRPPVILADEPTGNLDPENGRIVLSALAEYAAGGAAVLVVTHHENADHFADLKFQLIDGKLQSA